jgi:Tol biopolymer transport system component
VTLREFVNDLPGDVYDATLSPTGHRVALSWCHGVAPNYSCGVYLRPSAGGEPKLLFVGRELVQQLRWSPDGRWLAYISFQNWSRDGKWLYASRESLDLTSDVKPQLWKVNAARGSFKSLEHDRV